MILQQQILQFKNEKKNLNIEVSIAFSFVAFVAGSNLR